VQPTEWWDAIHPQVTRCRRLKEEKGSRGAEEMRSGGARAIQIRLSQTIIEERRQEASPMVVRGNLPIEIDEILVNLKEYLLTGDEGDKIAKIILFGSYARKTATPGSDVDILIVTLDGRDVESALLDRVYAFMVAHGVPIEAIVLSIHQFFPLVDYFLHNVMQYGVEVYSMEKGEIKKAVVEDISSLAEEYLDSAKEVLERGRIRLAIDAAYNAAELAAKALILLKQDDLPGSHGGVVSLFGQLYGKTKEVDPELGRKLNRALKLRNEARYRPGALLTKEDAYGVVELAEAFLKILTQKLSGAKMEEG